MNWDDFETLLRSSTDDVETTGLTPTWTDAELISFTNLALSNFSHHFPLESSSNITVVAGQRSYDLPADIVTPPYNAIVDVRWQRSSTSATHMVISRWKPGMTEAISSLGSNRGALLWGNKFLLEDAPTAADAAYPIELYYYAQHTPVPSDPSEYTFTVVDSDMECIYWYATSLMMMKLEAGDATLRQYASGDDLGSSRDDSPPRRSAQYRMRMYRECIATRKEEQAAPRLTRRVRR